MKTNVKIIIILGVVFLGAIGILFYRSNELFKKKISCTKLKEQIQRELDKDVQNLNSTSNPIGIQNRFVLIDLFYSERLNSCLYAANLQVRVLDEGKQLAKSMGRLAQDVDGYFIYDALTNKKLFESKNRSELDAKLDGMK